jgi:hypothetical protein
MFLSPYANGDISDLSYKGWGRTVFWENYGYIGVGTVALAVVAIYGAIVRRLQTLYVVAWGALLAAALLMVVSLATPVFALAHRFLPGMNMFRFPTRFMFVVDLALAVLGGIGLTRLESGALALAGRWRRRPSPLWLAIPILAFTVVDLVYHQPRQNPITDAERWFSPPITAQLIQQQGSTMRRIYSVGALDTHTRAFERARGWSGDLSPYLEQRELLEVNSNVYWGLSTPNCYVGLVPRWNREFWGPTGTITRAGLRTPTFSRLLALWNVHYLLTPSPVHLPGVLRLVGSSPRVFVYQVLAALPRAYLVPSASFYRTRREAEARMLHPAYDPGRQVLLDETDRAALDPALGLATAEARPRLATARIEGYRPNGVVVRTTSDAGGFLVLADSWYPGWVAEVDGRAARVLNANLGQRAVELPAGEHNVRFFYRPRVAYAGGWASGLALASLLAAIWLGTRAARRGRGVAHTEEA